MARLLIHPKQQRYNVRYEKNWIFIEANQFFYYFYLSFHNQRGAPLRPAAAHVETENTGQADAEGSLTERNTENVKLLRGLRRTALPDKGEEEHFHTRNPAGQSYARDTTIEKRTDLIVRCVW